MTFKEKIGGDHVWRGNFFVDMPFTLIIFCVTKSGTLCRINFFSTFSTRLLVYEHEYFFKAPSFRQVDKNTFLAFLLTVCICFYPMTFPALVALKKLNYFSDERELRDCEYD